MSPTLIILLACAVSYVLGSIPSGFLIAKARHVDIRAIGSGNIGATNVFRSVGKGWGILTFVCDFLKGFAPAFWMPMALPRESHVHPDAISVLAGCFSIIGHNWPVFLRFRGGKGVATSAGAAFGMAPVPACVGLATWVSMFLITRYVSVASMAIGITVPIYSWWRDWPDRWLMPLVLTAFGVLIILRHQENIRRLLAGTEHRFSFKRRSAETREADPPPGTDTSRRGEA
jgi:glycerol-3-phosphate acyltransferase PlsY